jgi:hypothetical protein
MEDQYIIREHREHITMASAWFQKSVILVSSQQKIKKVHHQPKFSKSTLNSAQSALLRNTEKPICFTNISQTEAKFYG